MPTKPTVTKVFAPDDLYTAGPAAGQPTKVNVIFGEGHVPGTFTAPEGINYDTHWLWRWVTDWVFLGTFAADEDAHIVETDSVGLLSAAFGEFIGTVAGVSPTLTVEYPDGPNQALRVLRSSSTSASAALIQSDDSPGNVLTVVSAATNTGVALSVTAPPANTATTVNIEGGGGTAVSITSAETAINIVSDETGISITSAQTAMTIVGDAGIVLTSGAAGPGISINTADTEPAPLRLIPRTEPAAPADGDIYVESDNNGDATNFQRLKAFYSGAFQTIWATPNSRVRFYAESLGESSTPGPGLVSKASITIPSSAGLRAGAIIHIRTVCEVGVESPGGVDRVALRIFDSTAAVNVTPLRPINVEVGNDAANSRYVTMTADYTIPADGPRTIFLGFTGDGANIAYIQNATIEITGQF